MNPFATRQLSEPIDGIEGSLLDVEQCSTVIRLLIEQIEGRTLRLVTLNVTEELDCAVSRIRKACNELRSQHSRLVGREV